MVNKTKQEFLQFFVNEHLPKYVINLLEDAYLEENGEDVEDSLFIGFTFDIFTEKFVNILCKLIEANWHTQHEDIARILKDLKSPDSIDSLYQAAIANHDYLSYSDASPLAVKCIWALFAIGTEEAKEKLKLLAHSHDEVTRRVALKRLNDFESQGGR